MLLVDAILEQHSTSIRTRRTFREQEFFFQGHYPQFPLVPGVLLCEAALQSGAILMSRRSSATTAKTQIPVATRLNNVKFKQGVLPGDTIEVQVEITEELANAVFMTGTIWKQSRLVARLEFACALAELAAIALPHGGGPS
jgi:3-hydroxyacyl-[acyl-carrier-protein] dehydratase